MKRATWITAVVCVILLADLVLFGQYLPPLVWHLRHENSLEMHGLRFKVPLMYIGSRDDRSNMLFIGRVQRRFSNKAALMRIEFRHAVVPRLSEAEEKILSEEVNGLSLPHRLREYKLRIVGREGSCVDYIPAGANESMSPDAPESPYIIECTLGDGVEITFNGTRSAVDDFYAIMRSGETIQGKH